MAKKRKASRAAKPARKASASIDLDESEYSRLDGDAAEKVKTEKPEGTVEKIDAAKGEDNVHEEAIERYERGFNKDRKNQEEGYDDLKFAADLNGWQWSETSRAAREAQNRPCLTVNQCGQFLRQVTGDIRQMRPAMKVAPVDDEASKDVAAKIMPGMVRYIEQRSDAKAAYFHGVDQTTAAGIGHWRVYTEYAAGTTRNQEIGVGPIEDGIGVVWDPDSVQPTRKDANWCFVPFDLSLKTAEKRWPGKSFTPLPKCAELYEQWYADEHVRVAEYWRKVPCKRELAFYPDGSIVDLTEDEDGAKRKDALVGSQMVDETGQVILDPATGQPQMFPADIEERDDFKVERWLMSAAEMLEPVYEWAGGHIPIVPCIGEEIQIGREVVRRGIIRGLKDVQRLYNWAISADAESVALQPKAPFIGTKKNFETNRADWEVANQENLPFLEYTPDEANQFAPPNRVAPPVNSSGIAELLQVATMDFSRVSGIYPASLGQAGNESSGKAIIARQREGDTGTYLYIESFGRAIQRTAEIVIDLIPHIYDTKRTIRIVGEDGKIDMLDINAGKQVDPNGDGIATKEANDVTVGCYEVSVEMGPSYSTKREEAREGIQALMTALGPETAALVADLFVKSQDFPLADKIGRRLQLALPKPIQEMEAAEAGEPPPQIPEQQPPPPTLAEKTAAGKLELDRAVAVEKDKRESEKATLAHEIDLKELGIKNRELDARLLELGAKVASDEQAHRGDMLDRSIDIHREVAGQVAEGEAAEQERQDGLAAEERTRAASIEDRDHAAGEAALDRASQAGASSTGGKATKSAKPAKSATAPQRSTGNGTATDQAQDARVDGLVEAVGQLRDLVMQIGKVVLGGGNQPQGAAEPAGAEIPEAGTVAPITVEPGITPPPAAAATAAPGIAIGS